MRECECELPVPRGKTANRPHDDHWCVKCSHYINPDWTSNDETVREFYDRLEESIFPLAARTAPAATELLLSFRNFRRQAEVREMAGRSKWSTTHHLTYDNAREATEEAADLANYMMFSLLSARRNGDPEETELALTAAQHAFEAWRYALALRGHRHRAFSDGVAA